MQLLNEILKPKPINGFYLTFGVIATLVLGALMTGACYGVLEEKRSKKFSIIVALPFGIFMSLIAFSFLQPLNSNNPETYDKNIRTSHYDKPLSVNPFARTVSEKIYTDIDYNDDGFNDIEIAKYTRNINDKTVKVTKITKTGKIYLAGLKKAAELAKNDGTTISKSEIKSTASFFNNDIYQFKFKLSTSPKKHYVIIASNNAAASKNSKSNTKTYYVSPK